MLETNLVSFIVHLKVLLREFCSLGAVSIEMENVQSGAGSRIIIFSDKICSHRAKNDQIEQEN